MVGCFNMEETLHLLWTSGSTYNYTNELWFTFTGHTKFMTVLSTLHNNSSLYSPLLTLALTVPLIHCPIHLSLFLRSRRKSSRCPCRVLDHAMPALPVAAWASDQDFSFAGPFINSWYPWVPRRRPVAHDAPWLMVLLSDQITSDIFLPPTKISKILRYLGYILQTIHLLICYSIGLTSWPLWCSSYMVGCHIPSHARLFITWKKKLLLILVINVYHIQIMS